MEFISFGVPGDSPTAPPKQIYMTIHGSADELQNLCAAIEQALHGGPSVIEARATNGAPIRLMVDRIGPALAAN